MPVTKPFEIKSRYNTVKGLTVIPEGPGPFPSVILSHGLISSKESSKYITVSDVFASAGISTCRFDYHGCGESGGDITDTTLTIRLDNLDAVFDYVTGMPFTDRDKMGLLGSSFGAVTSVIKAARDRRVRCISAWATPYLLGKDKDGTISGTTFRDDLYKDFVAYDILAEAQHVSNALVIHGDMDEVVPCAEGLEIFKNMREPKRCEIIKGGDHVLSDEAHRNRAIALALEWFREHL